MEARVTRLEEWAKLADQRMGRIEDKLDGLVASLAMFQADIRHGFVSKTEFETASRHQTNAIWAAAATIVGGVSLLFTAYQVLAPKPAIPAPVSAQPIVIQLPPPVSPAPSPSTGTERRAPRGG